MQTYIIICIEPIEAMKFSSYEFAVVQPNEPYFDNHNVATLLSTQHVDGDIKFYLTLANLSGDLITMSQGTEVDTVHYTNCISTLKLLKVKSTSDPVLNYVFYSIGKTLSNNIKPSFNIKLHNADLTNIQLTMLEQLLVEYINIYATSPYDLQCSNILQHAVEKPILTQPRCLLGHN